MTIQGPIRCCSFKAREKVTRVRWIAKESSKSIFAIVTRRMIRGHGTVKAVVDARTTENNMTIMGH